MHHIPSIPDENWRLSHIGRLLGHAMRRFDARVLTLMAHDVQVPLALSNLAAKGQISAAHIHLTRHLPLKGARLVDLAQAANMSKQAMAQLLAQCEAWGLIAKSADPRDARAKLLVFNDLGLQWLQGFERAVRQAEAEFVQELGAEVATVVRIGLDAYANAYND
jgi:DNA-binding MarR family transcriptional regulator